MLLGYADSIDVEEPAEDFMGFYSGNMLGDAQVPVVHVHQDSGEVIDGPLALVQFHDSLISELDFFFRNGH